MAVDFITDLPESRGYNTILVVIDWFSKACWLVSLQGLPIAMEITTVLFNQVFRNQVGRVRLELTHAFVDRTPFQCILGYQPPLFPWSGEPSDIPAVDDWARRSQEVWKSAHVHLQWATRRQRIQVDRHRLPHPRFQVGQQVWLSTQSSAHASSAPSISSVKLAQSRITFYSRHCTASHPPFMYICSSYPRGTLPAQCHSCHRHPCNTANAPPLPATVSMATTGIVIFLFLVPGCITAVTAAVVNKEGEDDKKREGESDG
ncbi:hypothetical protein QTP70_013980 [Hemibagrus guttatus]|uniref:Uncharacterized protein n=1 Tax=Hemibagrus guttatus TaxID=175788 RepID=A0AAE0V9N9_9TELE|nr:hypothetical protein QTP70_013980 [Hemibagrus guttatus]KAK3571940.1 hypothetical protein QTP86_020502 [Hemibagrus guttatus]